MKGTLFFFAYNAAADRLELWKSDGTAAGTRRVKQFFHNAILYGGSIAFKGRLYFGIRRMRRARCTSGKHRLLGPRALAQQRQCLRNRAIVAANEDSSYASELTRTSGRLYWIENSVTYVTDGTKASTSESSIPIPMAVAGSL